MNADRAIRFLAHEASQCRDRDTAEALCLLMPALLKILHLQGMDDLEANAVRYQVKQELTRVDEPHERAA